MLRWFRNLLFDSTSVQFQSNCELEEAVRRLGAGTRRWYSFQIFFTQAAVGSVAIDRFWLRRSRPYFHSGFQPYFVGHFIDVGGKATLVGRFGLNGWTKVFMCFWLGFCLIWTLGAAAAVAHDSGAPRALPLGGLGMFGMGIALVAGGKTLSREDISWLSSTIQDALDTAT
jgi:hypothetical protein